MLRYFCCLFLCFLSTAFCAQDKELNSISEALGHRIGKYLESLGIQVDLDLVIKGIKKEKKGANSPLTEDECMTAISELQDKLFEKQAEKNLIKANQFLVENAKKGQVIEIETKKLQYKVLKEGIGPQVQLSDAPLVQYVGKYIDGSIFGKTNEPEVVELDETILGFKKGILGMKEGEKRLLFIHPSLGYGKDHLTEPNSLLIFEIEVLKANGHESQDELISNFPDAKKGLR